MSLSVYVYTWECVNSNFWYMLLDGSYEMFLEIHD